MRASFVGIVFGLLAAAVPWNQQAEAPARVAPAAPIAPVAPVRVGVYDSRSVAIAFTASKHNERFMKETKERMEAARSAGDAATMRQIEAQMKERQRHFHEMGFSRADVSALIDPVRDRLPALADAAGVDVIVSRFELEYQREGTKLVNVTDAIVELYEPDERTRTWSRQAQESEPLPLDQVQGER